MPSQKHPVISQEGDLHLWKTGQYSDVRVTCRGQSMLLHRAILSRCPWFKEKMGNQFSDNNMLEINLDRFSPVCSRLFCRSSTALRFGNILLLWQTSTNPPPTEINDNSLQPNTFFDHEVLAQLYGLGATFKFPLFQTAVLNTGIEFLNSGIQYFSCRPRKKLTAGQIDQLLRGLRIAYAGDVQQQATLRGLYVHFFTECWRNVQNDPYFFGQIRAVPMFSVDLMENVGRKNAGRDRLETTIYTVQVCNNVTPSLEAAMKAAWEQD
ncbi:uncharacterized protein PG986_004189 [Apiospora aurea]|uniref:BTB domain-containing protein n=1 Tax=Apiospora aurea TaxID=335848 RepID=A0ABR1QMM1_9PEZI